MTLGDLLSLSRDITVTFALVVALVGTVRRWWLPYWVYQQALDSLSEMRKERDDYKRELFDSLGLADRATRVAEHTTERVSRRPRDQGEGT